MRVDLPDIAKTLIGVLLACAVAFLTGSAVHAADIELFTPFAYGAGPLSASALDSVAKAKSSPSTASVTLVTVDTAALGVTAAITLPDGSPVVAVRQPSPAGQFAASSWVGAWDGGRTVLFIGNGAITGTIQNGADRYGVTPLGDGVHMIVKLQDVAPATVADDAILIPGSDGRPSLSTSASGPEAATLAGVDVLVAYTSAAKAAYAGDINALIASQFVLANVMFGTSNAGAVLNLVGTVETSYDENVADGSQADWLRVLDALQAGTDPALAAVHAKRDELNADLVMLVLDKAHVSLCGSAYWGTVNGWLSADWAFGEVTIQDNCLSDGLTFTHELGHMFGATQQRHGALSALRVRISVSLRAQSVSDDHGVPVHRARLST